MQLEMPDKFNDLSTTVSTQFDVCGIKRVRVFASVCRGGVAKERGDWLSMQGGVCCPTGTLKFVSYLQYLL